MTQPVEIPNAPSNPYDELDQVAFGYRYPDQKNTCPFCLGLGTPWGGWFTCESDSCGLIALVATGQSFRPTAKRCAITIDRRNYANSIAATAALGRLLASGWSIAEVTATRDGGLFSLHTPSSWKLERPESPILPARDHSSPVLYMRADMQPDLHAQTSGFVEAWRDHVKAQIADPGVSSRGESPILDSAPAPAVIDGTAKIDSEDGAQANSSSTVREGENTPASKDS